jgi:hypothetical protein
MDKPNGQLTADVAERLAVYYDERGFDVLHDHGPDSKNKGEIVAYFGKRPSRKTELSQLDIAIFERSSKKICTLIEVEESSARPKTLLGDVFATLLAENIWFKGKNLEVCEHASLIVVGQGDESDKALIDHLDQQVESIRSMMGNAKMKFGRVMIDVFAEEAGLEKLLREKVDATREC